MSEGPSREVRHFALHDDRNVDLLFLIDNSPSMGEKQRNLARSIPSFVDTLAALPGGLPSLHLGVVTSDLGTLGAADPEPGPAFGPIGDGGCEGAGDAGALERSGAPITGAPFLRDTIDATGQRVRNYTGALADAVSQMTLAGANGCGFEQSLEAIHQALNPGNPTNTGFMRDDAMLGIVIVSDEDDCSLAHASMLVPGAAPLGPRQSFRCTRFGVVCDDGGRTPDAMNQVGVKARCHPNDASPYLTRVADYTAFLTQLKPDPDQLFIAGIIGPTTPFATELRSLGGTSARVPALAHACAYLGDDVTGDGAPDPQVADPAVRIHALLDQFPGHSAASSICQQDLSGGLGQVSQLIRAGLGRSCITGKLPSGAAQPDCEVSATGGDAASPSALPRCTVDGTIAGAPACWHLVVDTAGCPAGDHLRVAVEGQDRLPRDAQITASCAIEPAL